MSSGWTALAASRPENSPAGANPPPTTERPANVPLPSLGLLGKGRARIRDDLCHPQQKLAVYAWVYWLQRAPDSNPRQAVILMQSWRRSPQSARGGQYEISEIRG